MVTLKFLLSWTSSQVMQLLLVMEGGMLTLVVNQQLEATYGDMANVTAIRVMNATFSETDADIIVPKFLLGIII
jgi:hypothetical protein